jgi:uncharacterized protein (DUF1697 family)
MPAYISVLRGINVGGHKRIKMTDLAQLYTELGFGKVQTYIQSGNVIFQSGDPDPRHLEELIENGIRKTFSNDVTVIVMNLPDFQQIVEKNPFLADHLKIETFLHVTFLSGPMEQNRVDSLNEIRFPDEEFALSGKAVYLYCPKGYGTTRLNNNFFETRLKTGATTRNWKTTKELLNIALNLKEMPPGK